MEEDRIFFKDKKGVLQGPHTEAQVQTWYRKGWYEGATQFHFAIDGSAPGESAHFISLDGLRSFNGVGSPFRRVDESAERGKGRRAELASVIDGIEMEIAQLRVACECVQEMEKQIEQVEKEIEKLVGGSATPAAAATDTERAAAATKKPAAVQPAAVAKPKEIPLWVAEMVELGVDYVDMLRTRDTTALARHNHRPKNSLDTMHLLVERRRDPEARKIVREELVRQLKTREYFLCSFCDFYAVNYKHLLIHLIEEDHVAASGRFAKSQRADWDFGDTVNISMVGRELVEGWFNEEGAAESRFKAMASPVILRDADLRPSLSFFPSLLEKFKGETGDLKKVPSSQLYKRIDDLRARLGQNSLGERMYAELHEHLGNHRAQCFLCMVVFKNREDYYTHHRSILHLIQGAANDIATHIINFVHEEREKSK